MSNDNAPVPTGWSVDDDGWFVRPLRQSDISVDDACHFGFTCEGNVYVREPRHCHDFDRGVITPWRSPS